MQISHSLQAVNEQSVNKPTKDRKRMKQGGIDTSRLICSPTTPPSTNCYHPR